MLRNLPINAQLKMRLTNVLQRSQESFLRWKEERKEEKARRSEERSRLYISIPSRGHWSEYSPIT